MEWGLKLKFRLNKKVKAEVQVEGTGEGTLYPDFDVNQTICSNREKRLQKVYNGRKLKWEWRIGEDLILAFCSRGDFEILKEDFPFYSL